MLFNTAFPAMFSAVHIALVAITIIFMKACQQTIPYNEEIFFITFNCYNWMLRILSIKHETQTNTIRKCFYISCIEKLG